MEDKKYWFMTTADDMQTGTSEAYFENDVTDVHPFLVVAKMNRAKEPVFDVELDPHRVVLISYQQISLQEYQLYLETQPF